MGDSPQVNTGAGGDYVPEWHDVRERPPRGPLWLYIESGEFARVEMATADTTGEQVVWHSAFSPDITYDANCVNAWAVVTYPLSPKRRWVDASESDGAQ